MHFDLLMVIGEACRGIGESKQAFALFQRALDVETTRLPAAAGKRVHKPTLLARSQGYPDDLMAAAHS